MTKFEQVGVNYQKMSTSKEDAMQKFEHSCDICACRGMRIDCDKCAIAVFNKLVVAIYDGEV